MTALEWYYISQEGIFKTLWEKAVNVLQEVLCDAKTHQINFRLGSAPTLMEKLAMLLETT